MRASARRGLVLALAAASFAAGAECGGGAKPSPPPPCDQVCMDQTALRALREMIKLAYNQTLQGNEVGPQDATSNCLPNGTVHVFGTATSNAVQGATMVQLTYVFDNCRFQKPQDTDPTQNYDMTLTGTVQENGTIAAQPTANTSLQITSDSMTFSGTVETPPVSYDQPSCSLAVTQDGNTLSGTMCGRPVGVTL